MKKNSCFYTSVIVAFIFGFALGLITYANRDIFNYDSDVVCLDGTTPDKHGCCSGEIYTDMGDLGFNCCPEVGGDCFPPLR